MESDEFYVTSPRSAPRYGRFMLIGAVLGIIAGILLVQFGPSEGLYAIGDVTAAVLLMTIPIGAVLGSVVALLIDRRSMKKSGHVD